MTVPGFLLKKSNQGISLNDTSGNSRTINNWETIERCLLKELPYLLDLAYKLEFAWIPTHDLNSFYIPVLLGYLLVEDGDVFGPQSTLVYRSGVKKEGASIGDEEREDDRQELVRVLGRLQHDNCQAKGQTRSTREHCCCTQDSACFTVHGIVVNNRAEIAT